MQPINRKNKSLESGVEFTPHITHRGHVRGFTIVEILMVMAIILILSTIILANYSAGQKELALQRAAHKLAQDIRRTQEMAMSSKDFGNPPTPSKGGYGIYFNVNEPNHYILFADCDNDKSYDVDGSAFTCFSAEQFTGYSELVEDISLEKSVKIGGISSGLSLYITFVPPNPDADFYPDAQESIITLTTGDSHKSVKINKAGLIEIEFLASSSTPTYTPTPAPTYTPTPTPIPTCKSNGTDCLTNDECCSNACYIDNDGDSYAGTSGNRTCKASAALPGIDCDDNNSSIYPGTTCNGDCSVCNTSGNCDPKSAGENGLPACQRCDGSSFSHVNIATFVDSEGSNTCSGTCAGYCDSGSCIDTDTAAGTCIVSTNTRVSSGGDGSCSSGTCSVTRVGKFWIGGTGNWSDTTHWSISSGGAGGASVPTSTDNVYFDANSFSSGSQIVTVDTAANCADMDWTGVLNNQTFAGSAALNISGSLTFVSGMNPTYSGTITFTSTATGKTVTVAKTLACAITFDGTGGSWQLQDDLNIGSKTIKLTRGTLDTNGKTVTCGPFDGSATNTRTLTLGASTINASGNWFFNSGGLTLNAGTSIIKLTGASYFYGAYKTYNEVQLNGTSHIVLHNNSFTTLTRTGTATKTDSVTFYADQTITGTLTLNGNSSTNRLMVKSSVAGTKYTLTAAAISVSNADFMDIGGAGAGNWDLSGITGGSGNCAGNTGITFTPAVTRYWVATSGGSWSATSSWSAFSGGASGASVPLCQDTVVFDANSITSTGKTITIDIVRVGTGINFSSISNTPNITLSNAIYILGGLNLTGVGTFSGNYYIYFWGRGAYQLTSNSKTLYGIYVEMPNNTLTLQDNLTLSSSGYIYFYSGTLDFNNKNVTAAYFSSTTATTRTLTLGSGTFTLNGSGTATKWNCSTSTNLTITASTGTIVLTSSGTNAQTFAGGGKTYNNIQVTGAGNYTMTFTGANTFNDFKIDTPPKTVKFTAGTTATITVTTFTVSGTAGNLITIGSATAATHTLTKAGGGTISSNYLSISYSAATPATTWYAGANSTNGGNNTGWIFTAPP